MRGRYRDIVVKQENKNLTCSFQGGANIFLLVDKRKNKTHFPNYQLNYLFKNKCRLPRYPKTHTFSKSQGGGTVWK